MVGQFTCRMIRNEWMFSINESSSWVWKRGLMVCVCVCADRVGRVCTRPDGEHRHLRHHPGLLPGVRLERWLQLAAVVKPSVSHCHGTVCYADILFITAAHMIDAGNQCNNFLHFRSFWHFLNYFFHVMHDWVQVVERTLVTSSIWCCSAALRLWCLFCYQLSFLFTTYLFVPVSLLFSLW